MKQAITASLFASAFSAFLCGCASHTFSSHIIPTLEYGAPEEVVIKKLKGDSGDNIYFLSGGYKYRYIAFQANTNLYYSFLFRDGQLDTVAEASLLWYRHYRKCTRFPIVRSEPVDTDKCFDTFVTMVRGDRIDLKNFTGHTKFKKKSRREAADAVELATYAAMMPQEVLVGLGVVATGAVISSASKSDDHGKKYPKKSLEYLLNAKLSNISAEISHIPAELRSAHGDDETLLVIGQFYEHNTVAIGAKSGLITWIDANPNWSCEKNKLSCRLHAR